MRFFFLLTYLLCVAAGAGAQSGPAIAIPVRICYAGRDAQLVAAACSCRPEQLVLTTSNGSIRKHDSGRFTYRPERVSQHALVKAYCVKSRGFFPACQPGVPGGLSAGTGSDDLSGFTDIWSDFPSWDARLTGFDCSLKLAATGTFSKIMHATDGFFTPEMKQSFSQLHPGDRIYFDEVKAIASDGRERKMGSLTVVIW